MISFRFVGNMFFDAILRLLLAKQNKENSGMENIQTVSKIDAQEMRSIYEVLTFSKLFREASIVQIGCNVPLKSRDLLGLRHDQFVTNANGERYIRSTDLLGHLCRLNPSVITERDRLFQRNPHSKFLFPSHRVGASRSEYVTRTTVAAAFREHGCVFRGRVMVLDDLRKVWGRRYLAEGGSLSVLRAVFNQASMQVTAKYLELDNVDGCARNHVYSQSKPPLVTIAPLYLAGVKQ